MGVAKKLRKVCQAHAPRALARPPRRAHGPACIAPSVTARLLPDPIRAACLQRSCPVVRWAGPIWLRPCCVAAGGETGSGRMAMPLSVQCVWMPVDARAWLRVQRGGRGMGRRASRLLAAPHPGSRQTGPQPPRRGPQTDGQRRPLRWNAERRAQSGTGRAWRVQAQRRLSADPCAAGALQGAGCGCFNETRAGRAMGDRCYARCKAGGTRPSMAGCTTRCPAACARSPRPAGGARAGWRCWRGQTSSRRCIAGGAGRRAQVRLAH